MSPRGLAVTGAFGVALAALAWTLYAPVTPEQRSDEVDVQLTYGVSEPRARQAVARGRALRSALQAEGVADIGGYVQELTREAEITEADIVAYHEAHPEIFGDRPLRQCRRSIERILSARQARAALAARRSSGAKHD